MSCCNSGLNVTSNELEVAVNQLKREVEKLIKSNTEKFLCQDKKIADVINFVKTNLSNSLRDLLDTMVSSGELNEIIESTITDLETSVSELISENGKFYVYAPSLLNSEGSESIALVMNNKYAFLFDAGRSTTASESYSYLSSKLGSRKLNAIFISHYHHDHVDGLSTLLPLLDKENGKVYLPMNFVNYLNNSTDDVETLIDIRDQTIRTLDKLGYCYEEVSEDKTLTYEEILVSLLNSNSQAYTYYRDHNSRYNAFSMNAIVSIGESRVLFPGDSVRDTQDYLLSIGQVKKVSVYASSHHGYERYQNSEYLDTINPDYEYYSVSPLSWNSVLMTNYDYVLRPVDAKRTSEAFGEVEFVVSTDSTEQLKGYYSKGNMFVNKRLDVYVNPEYAGIPDGSKERPFKSLSQAVSYLPDSLGDITFNLASGTYEAVRIMNTTNTIQFVTDGDVTMKNVQIFNAGAVYFNSYHFIGEVDVNYARTYFANCTFECASVESGNICVSGNRSNISFANCTFGTCYTGIYSESGCQVTVKGCTFDCSAYAIYGKNSYIALDTYTITSGNLREDVGCKIVALTKGNISALPIFNDSNYMRGYEYFATNLGFPVFYYNHDGMDHWIKADGTEVA